MSEKRSSIEHVQTDRSNVNSLYGKWKWIPGFEGRYQASTNGFVKSFCISSEGHVLRQNEKRGYLYVKLIDINGDPHDYRVHRLVYRTFRPHAKLDRSLHIHHVNFNKKDNRLVNLKRVTARENFYFSLEHGNIVGFALGSANRNAVLNERQVYKIREEFSKNKVTMVELAKRYGVSRKCIYNVVHNKTWKHLKQEKTKQAVA